MKWPNHFLGQTPTQSVAPTDLTSVVVKTVLFYGETDSDSISGIKRPNLSCCKTVLFYGEPDSDTISGTKKPNLL
ncbi:hypothetical protein CEXT_589001 [Caerostris extrusa]|uniref:Uncharacterized protein n=1 Tax=Caerostris extrusa TaxID=172846 RepID=A0AAV4TMR2_CAEEX|nr:hypothetical protein CEXT_589001 [Caerostris extrusa]